MRGRFFWRIGCLFAGIFIVALFATSFLLWFVAGPERPPFGERPFFGFPLVLIVLAGLAIAIGARGVRRVAAPVGDLIEAAARVEAGDYGTRVAERGPPEVRALTRAFNEMSARLQANDEERRTLLAEVTHELRTPLTVVQGNLEALLDGVYPADEEHLAAIHEETHVLSRLIDDLRTLALAERGSLALQREPTDLDLLVGDTLASFKAQAAAAGVTLTAETGDDLPLAEVDPVRIREVLANLITNALRSAESRGTGLGLAVAKKILDAHRGTIEAESTMGEGTTIRFSLPIADAPAASHSSSRSSTER